MNTRIASGVLASLLALAHPTGNLQAADKSTEFGGINVRYLSLDSRTGSSKAVIVDPCPLAHTAQILPINRKGELVSPADVSAQAEQVLDNVDLALKSGKSSLKRTVKLNVYIKNADANEAVSKVLAKRFFGNEKPAVTFVGGDLPQPSILVAMDAVGISSAVAPNNSVQSFHLDSLSGSSSHVAILPANGAIYVAGMADKNPLDEATRNTLGKLHGVIHHFGLEKKDIVQLKAFVQPMTDVATVEKEIKTFFGEHSYPPTVFVEWKSSSVPVEIELIAAAPKTKTDATNSVSYITPPGTTAAPVYSRVAQINFGKRIYISGLYGQTVPENDAKEIFNELDTLAQKAGTDMEHLVKATYYFSEPPSNARLDALRPQIYNPQRPPAASKAQVKNVGKPGKGLTVDMIAVTK